MGLTPDRKIQLLAKKWRNERNFWISALVVLLWYVLGGLMSLQEQNAQLRQQVVLQQQESSKEGKKKKSNGSKTSTEEESTTTTASPVEIEMTETKKDK